MTGPPRLDGRRARLLETELLRRAEAVLGADGRNPEVGPVARAILGMAARIGEEVSLRLDKVPAKQEDNFYTAAGIGRDPARPAILPVAFKLADGRDEVVTAPAGTQLMAEAGGPVVFETEARIDLAPGTIAALRGLDATKDAIAMPSSAVIGAKLPHVPALGRRLRSGAAAGATQLQIDPAAGLEAGILLSIGEGDAARHYTAIAVEGDLVTIEPALETETAPNVPVVEVTAFAPFAATSRNHQSHALYLGHATLLDVPSAVTITVSGTSLPEVTEWSWWGQLGEDDPPAWQMLAGAGPSFTKVPGKLVKKKIRGHESLWLRAELPGKSTASAHGQDVRIAIGGGGPCGDRSTRCTTRSILEEMNVGFEAIANTTPVVTNSPFHPFGREPRLYDSFYIGSDEAFSKVGADVSLCFNFAGADLGRMAAIKETDTTTRIFGVGADGLLYRALMPTPVGGSTQKAELRPVPSPSKDGRTALFQKHSPIALWKTMTVEYVAVAALHGTAIYVARLDVADDLPKTKWWRLPLPPSNNADVRALAVHSGSTTPVLYALVGPDLYVWTGVSDGALPTDYGTVVQDLMQVEPSDPITGIDSVLIVEEATTAGQVTLVRKSAGTWSSSPFTRTGFLPAEALHAFVDLGDPAKLFIAGYDLVLNQWTLQLAEVPAGSLTPFALTSTTLPVDDPLPVAFSPGRSFTLTGPNPPPFPKRPILSVATRNPVHVSWRQSGPNVLQPVLSWEPTSIGTSANLSRGFVGSADYVAVQRPDVGLLFRSSAGGAVVGDIRVPAAPGYLADALQVPAPATEIVYFKSNGLGVPFDAFVVSAPAASGKTILKLRSPPAPNAGDDIVAFSNHPTLAGTEGTGANAGDIRLTGTNAFSTVHATIKPNSTSTVQEIWHFTTPQGGADWLDPVTSIVGPNRYFQVLIEIGRDSGWAEAALLPIGSPVETALTAGEEVWRANNAAFQGASLFKYSGGGAVSYPHADILLFGGQALFLTAPGQWQSVGPDLVPNPALSWEYWNGDSWWALATVGTGSDGLVDDTAHFIKDGGVFFKVPRDIQPTDVGGRKSHWLRARLVGGDYGEAKVTVTTPPGTTDQVVIRDLSTIRAPYVTSLKLGYCAQEAIAPEIVLTEDSLGAIDQTSANQAGFEFPVFTPVGELMNPVNAAEEAAKAAAEAGRCDDPCPETEKAKPSPCAAPGAYDSCDSPCIAPPDYRRPAEAAAQGFVRGLMIGFDKGFSGNTISLYVDAEPAGLPAELIAEVLHGGRFVPINVAKDTSYGLTESGILTLAMPDRPDRSALFGADAHWLRLRPRLDPAGWSPQLRAIHLNAAQTRSVETRTMERLGTSVGIEDQEFRLAEAPVEPGSLVLRVREPLAEEDNPDGRLDVTLYPKGLPGQWVRWQAADDLVEEAEPGRVFMFDAEQGIIRFGNGRTGRIPPLGADVLAERYARVAGSRANGVAPGKELQLLAPLANVERAAALDYAAGGVDAEALESARRRAAAKVRHGSRILTRADLEDHALTLSPGIAQVRAEDRRGGVRLIVVLNGADPRPSPAALRGFAAAVGAVSGFGLARPGGLDVVGPRLLPIAIALELQPRMPDLFAEAAERAKALLAALFDPATGNHDGRGWPLGRLPDEQDVAAALAPIAELALPVSAALERADKETAAERRLPEAIPSDVLVRLDPSAIAFERAREEAA